ncbi:uncharacterized protein [Salminus brasiliensis]|uniref:uncharacterized protein n=1 Tax=Salminus brasiliensis TaxID=930266 RepID=UPI003B833DE6
MASARSGVVLSLVLWYAGLVFAPHSRGDGLKTELNSNGWFVCEQGATAHLPQTPVPAWPEDGPGDRPKYLVYCRANAMHVVLPSGVLSQVKVFEINPVKEVPNTCGHSLATQRGRNVLHINYACCKLPVQEGSCTLRIVYFSEGQTEIATASCSVSPAPMPSPTTTSAPVWQAPVWQAPVWQAPVWQAPVQPASTPQPTVPPSPTPGIPLPPASVTVLPPSRFPWPSQQHGEVPSPTTTSTPVQQAPVQPASTPQPTVPPSPTPGIPLPPASVTVLPPSRFPWPSQQHGEVPSPTTTSTPVQQAPVQQAPVQQAPVQQAPVQPASTSQPTVPPSPTPGIPLPPASVTVLPPSRIPWPSQQHGCLAGGKLVFAISANTTDPPLNPSSLTVAGQSGCKPAMANKDFAVFKFSVTECGTRTYRIGDTTIYLVEVRAPIRTLDFKYGKITRDHPVRMMIECRYSKVGLRAPAGLATGWTTAGYMVMSTSLPALVRAKGLFGVQLRIAKDKTFSTFLPHYHQPLRVLLGKPVYLEVRLNSPKPEATLLVHYCVAYPRSAKSALVLLYEGCPNPLDSDNIAILHMADLPQNRHQRRFEVNAFQFMDQSTNKYLDEEIYFMCSTEVCMPSQTPCKETCFDMKVCM